MSTFCQTLIDKFKQEKSPIKKAMIKTLKKVQDEDIKAKEIFEKKKEYLAAKKAKALENRRNTIKKKNRKRNAASAKAKGKKKRPKLKEE